MDRPSSLARSLARPASSRITDCRAILAGRLALLVSRSGAAGAIRGAERCAGSPGIRSGGFCPAWFHAVLAGLGAVDLQLYSIAYDSIVRIYQQAGGPVAAAMTGDVGPLGVSRHLISTQLL